MLDDYRTWLESELKLLGNASHHAYAFGQANMAKRALEKLDELLAGKVCIAVTMPDAEAALLAIDTSDGTSTPPMHRLADELRKALGRAAEA